MPGVTTFIDQMGSRRASHIEQGGMGGGGIGYEMGGGMGVGMMGGLDMRRSYCLGVGGMGTQCMGGISNFGVPIDVGANAMGGPMAGYTRGGINAMGGPMGGWAEGIMGGVQTVEGPTGGLMGGRMGSQIGGGGIGDEETGRGMCRINAMGGPTRGGTANGMVGTNAMGSPASGWAGGQMSTVPNGMMGPMTNMMGQTGFARASMIPMIYIQDNMIPDFMVPMDGVNDMGSLGATQISSNMMTQPAITEIDSMNPTLNSMLTSPMMANTVPTASSRMGSPAGIPPIRSWQ